MQARTAFGRGRMSPAIVVTFVVAMLGALLLGGAGGYLVRAMSSPALTTVTAPIVVPQTNSGPQQPALPDWAYRKQSQPTVPQQTLDPNGNVIHF
jgi:hypothetical protein